MGLVSGPRAMTQGKNADNFTDTEGETTTKGHIDRKSRKTGSNKPRPRYYRVSLSKLFLSSPRVTGEFNFDKLLDLG